MKPRLLSAARLSLPLATALAALLGVSSASAAAINWTGLTNGTWNTTTNWSGGAVPLITDDITVLGPANVAGALTIDFNANNSAKSLNFTNTAATSVTNITSAADKTLTLGSGGITTGTGAVQIGANVANQAVNLTLGAAQTWNVGSGGLTVTNFIGGLSTGITKTGTGNLTINTGIANGFTGGLKANLGTLNLDYGNLAIPTNLIAAINALQVNNGTLTITGKNVTSATTAQTFAGTTLGAGRNTVNIAKGALATSATLNLGALTIATGSNTIFSPTTAWTTAASTTEIVRITAGGSVPTLPGAGTTAFVNAGMFHRVAGGGVGTLRLAAVNELGQLLLKANAGAVSATMNDATGSFQYGDNVSYQLTNTGASIYGLLLNTTSNGLTLTLANSGFLTLNSVIQIKPTEGVNIAPGTGTSNIIVGAERNLVLAMDNAAGLTISAIIANFNSSGGAGGTSSAVTVFGSAPTGVPGTVTLSGANNYTGGTFINNGTLTFTSLAAAQNGLSRNVTFSGGSGTLNVVANTSLGQLSVNDGVTANLSGTTQSYVSATGSGTINYANGNATLSLNNASAFQGNVRLNVGGNSTVRINLTSLGDAASPDSGNLSWGGGTLDNSQAGTIDLALSAATTWDNRRIELRAKNHGGAGATGSFQTAVLNSSSTTPGNFLTINTDLLNTTDRDHNFSLGGANTGDNAFNGVIKNATPFSSLFSGTGALTLQKNDAGKWILGGNNTYSGGTTITAGTLQIGNGSTNGTLGSGAVANAGTLVFNRNNTYTLAAGNLVTGAGAVTLANTGSVAAVVDNQFNTTGALNFGSSAGSTTASALDLTNGSSTFGSLSVQTNSASTNTITVGNGKTLTFTGTAINVGTNAVAGTVNKLTVGGASSGVGSLVVNNAAAVVNVGVGPGADATATASTLDLSDLGSVSLGTIAAPITTLKVGARTTSGTLLLSNTANVITVTNLDLGHSNGGNQGATNLLTLGTGTNVLNANTINIGFSKATATLGFASQTAGSPGTVTIVNKAGANGLAALNIGSQNGTSTGTGLTGTLDLRGHIATVNVGVVTMGNTNQAGAGNANGVIRFDAGTFDATSLSLGLKSSSGTGSNNGNAVNVGGGTFTVSGAVAMSSHTGTGATGNVTSKLNVTNGTVNLGSTLSVANKNGTGGEIAAGEINVSGGALNVTGVITLATQASAGSATGLLNITGGVVTANSDIVDGGGTTTTTFTLDGGSLDMTGKNIGGATPIDVLNFRSGTLSSVNTINSTGGLTKTTSGTLTLGGTNGYTGATSVDAGKLLINGSTNTSSAVTVKNTATLGGNGTIGGTVTVQSGGTFSPGNSIDSIASGDLTLLANATFEQEINKAAAANESGDLTVVTGALALTNGSLLALVELGGSGIWNVGDKITLIGYSSGTWNNELFTYNSSVLADDSTFSFSGIDWTFNYNDTTPGDNYTTDMSAFAGVARYVTLTTVPEPRAALLGAIGLLMLLRRRR